MQKRQITVFLAVAGVLVVSLVLLFILNGTPATTTTALQHAELAAATTTPDPTGLPGLLTTMAPWDANNDTRMLKARLDTIKLPWSPMEGAAVHTHQHLDIFIFRDHIEIPASIGVASDGKNLTPIHVHDTSGVIHVESPVVREFTLGMFFDVWGVRLTGSCIGGYCADGANKLRIYVNGTPYTGNPRELTLEQHQEIAITFGYPEALPNPIPSSYVFPAGI